MKRPALVIAIVLGALFTLTCGGVAACLGFLTHWQEEAVLSDAASIGNASKEIADLAVPADFEPATGMRMTIPFTDRPLVYYAMYEGNDPLRYLMMFAIRKDAMSDTSALRDEIERMLGTATGATPDLVVDREWTDPVDVHGVPVDFRFRHSANPTHTAEVTDATGMFDGAFGPATVVYVTMGPFDDAGFRAMFK
jgi:hypothetical protein